MPKFIAVSGPNGVGKTTFIGRLKQELESAGKSVEVFKAPNYGTPSGLVIKSFLEGNKVQGDIEDVFARNRLEVQILASQSNADFVVLDRWIFDADCYAEFRGMQRGRYNGELKPDIQIVLTAIVPVIVQRLKGRDIKNIYYEQSNIRLLQQIMIDKAKKREHGKFTYVLDNTVTIGHHRWDLLLYLIAGDITCGVS